MRRKRMVWFVLGCCLTATTAIILAARGAWQAVIFHPKAPPLISAYGDLAEFWGEAAKSLKLEPEEAYLQQWNIGYDPNGEILYQTFKIYVDKGSGTHDVYYYSQDKHSTGSGWSASWSRQHLDGPAAEGLVPAHLAFAAINQIGFRELERHQNLQPPLRFWFLAESGSKTYRPIAGGNVVQGSQITPIAPDGVTMQGEHGTFGIAEGAVATTGNSVTTATHENPGPPVFIVPLSTN